MASWSPRSGAVSGGGAGGDGPARRLELPVAGHTWHLLVRPTIPLIVEASQLALDVAAAHLPGPSIEIGELPAIAGDAALLRQVLDQLIANALHGGEMGVEPNPGGGSTFWFTVAGTEIGTPELAAR